MLYLRQMISYIYLALVLIWSFDIISYDQQTCPREKHIQNGNAIPHLHSLVLNGQILQGFVTAFGCLPQKRPRFRGV